MRLQQEQDALILAKILYGQNKTRRKRRYWVRPWLEKRLQFGAYRTLMRELEAKFPDYFINYMRMEPIAINVSRGAHHSLSERVRKQTTSFRKPLEHGLKLAITPPAPCHRGELSQPWLPISGVTIAFRS